MSKGYRSYRGRASKGKIALAVLLVLIILAALSVLAMQRYIAYDENGVPFLRLPERDTPEPGPAEEPPSGSGADDLELIIQEPEEPEEPPVKAFSLSALPLTGEAWTTARAEAGMEYNAVSVVLKDAEGKVYYASESAVRKAKKPGEDTMETLAAVTGDETLHTIARFSCLLDPTASRVDVEAMGLKNTGGYIFYDGNYAAWLDPGKEAARQYLCSLVREIAELGFDEILLTEVSYPTQGKLDKINYNSEAPIEENLSLLLEELRKVLEPYDIILSMELPEAVIMEGADETAGLRLSHAARWADRIYAVTEPDRADTLSARVLQMASSAENRVQGFIPEFAVPVPEWEGGFLVLPPDA